MGCVTFIVVSVWEMIDDKEIKRINELAKKAKAEGLEDHEKIEQQKLRKKYIAAVKKNVKSHLSKIKIID